MQTIKVVCIKNYSPEFVVGECYTAKEEHNGYYNINNRWFVADYNSRMRPILSEYFISLSEYRKIKLENINNIFLK